MSEYPLWTLDEALPIIRNLVFALREVKYAVALGGSILYRGTSDKDIDVILYPYKTYEKNEADLKSALVKFGLVCKENKEQVHSRWREKGVLDTKHVEVWEYQGKRVDLIFLE